MKKQILSLICTVLIGLSGALYGAENSQNGGQNKPQDEVLKALPTEGEVTPTDSQGVQPPANAVPLLVPFDQKLYTEFCSNNSDFLWGRAREMLTYMLFGSVILTGCAYHVGSTGIFTIVQNFWKSPFYLKGLSLQHVWQLGALGIATMASAKMFGGTWKSYTAWEDRVAIADLAKQKIWHEELFNKLGKPEIIGTVPTTGKYWLKCIKANSIVHETFDFDPFNADHVKQILFGGTNMQCSRIIVHIIDTV